MATLSPAAPPVADTIARLNAISSTLHLTFQEQLQLWSLHKQAVEGDASNTPVAAYNQPEKMRWEAREKLRGVSKGEAARFYSYVVDILARTQIFPQAEYDKWLAVIRGESASDLSAEKAAKPAAHLNGSAGSGPMKAAGGRDIHIPDTPTTALPSGLGTPGVLKEGVSGNVSAATPVQLVPMPSITSALRTPVQLRTSSVVGSDMMSPRVTSLMEVTYCGYLLKQSEYLRTWNVRFFKLKSNILSYGHDYANCMDAEHNAKFDFVLKKGVRFVPSAKGGSPPILKDLRKQLLAGPPEKLPAAGDAFFQAPDQARLPDPSSSTLTRHAEETALTYVNRMIGNEFHPFDVVVGSKVLHLAATISVEEKNLWLNILGWGARENYYEPTPVGSPATVFTSPSAPASRLQAATPPSVAVMPSVLTTPTNAPHLPPPAREEPAGPELPPAPLPVYTPVAFQPPGMPAPPHDAMLQQQLSRLLELATTTAGNWEPNGVKEGVTCYVPFDRIPAARGDGFVPFPRRAIKELLVDIDRKSETDSQFDSGYVVQGWNEHSTITYMKFKGILFVQSRDFCNVTHWRVDEDGNLLIVAWSATDSRCPEQSGAVRAHLEIGGWVIRPRPGAEYLRRKYGPDIEAGRRPPPFLDPEIDSEGCDCTYLMRSDFKGSIPTAVTSKVASQQAVLVAKVRDVLTDLYKPSGKLGPSALASVKRAPLVNDGQLAWTPAPVADAPLMRPTAPVPVSAPSAAIVPARKASEAAPRLIRKYQSPLLPPDQYHADLEKHVAMLKQYATDESLWTPNGTSNGVQKYVGKTSCPSARSVGTVPYPRRAIWDLLARIELKPVTDEQCEEGRSVVTWNEQSSLSYMRYKGKVMVAGRDLLNLTHWRVEEDGTLLIVAWSVADDVKCPEVKGLVRGHVHIGGWVIKPKPGADYLRHKYAREIAAGTRPPPHADPEIDAEGCECTYLMQTDFKGNIPEWLTRQVGAQQGTIVHTVRQALDIRYSTAPGQPGPAALAQFRQQPMVNIPETIAAIDAAAYSGGDSAEPKSELNIRSPSLDVQAGAGTLNLKPQSASEGIVQAAGAPSMKHSSQPTGAEPAAGLHGLPPAAPISKMQSGLTFLTKFAATFSKVWTLRDTIDASELGGKPKTKFRCKPLKEGGDLRHTEYIQLADVATSVACGVMQRLTRHVMSRKLTFQSCGMGYAAVNAPFSHIPATPLVVLHILSDINTRQRVDHTWKWVNPVESLASDLQLVHLVRQPLASFGGEYDSLELLHYRIVDVTPDVSSKPLLLVMNLCVPSGAKPRAGIRSMKEFSIMDTYVIEPDASGGSTVGRVLVGKQSLLELLDEAEVSQPLELLGGLCTKLHYAALQRDASEWNKRTGDLSALLEPLGPATAPLLEYLPEKPLVPAELGASPLRKTISVPGVGREISYQTLLLAVVAVVWALVLNALNALPVAYSLSALAAVPVWGATSEIVKTTLVTKWKKGVSAIFPAAKPAADKMVQLGRALRFLRRHQTVLQGRPLRPCPIMHKISLPCDKLSALVEQVGEAQNMPPLIGFQTIIAKAANIALFDALISVNLDTTDSAVDDVDVPLHCVVGLLGSVRCRDAALSNLMYQKSVSVFLNDPASRSLTDLSVDSALALLGEGVTPVDASARAHPLITVYTQPSTKDGPAGSDLNGACSSLPRDAAIALLTAPVQLHVVADASGDAGQLPTIQVQFGLDPVLRPAWTEFIKILNKLLRSPQLLESMRVNVT